MGHGINCAVHHSGPCDCYLSEERDAVAGFLDSQRGMLSRTIGQIKDEAKAELVKQWQDEDAEEWLLSFANYSQYFSRQTLVVETRWIREAIARAKSREYARIRKVWDALPLTDDFCETMQKAFWERLHKDDS